MDGQEGWFQIDVDTENYTLEFKKEADLPHGPSFAISKHKYIMSPEDIKKIDIDPSVNTDFYGCDVEGEKRLPGPFVSVKYGKKYSIDPRK